MNGAPRLLLALCALLTAVHAAGARSPQELLDAGMLRAQLVIDSEAPLYQRAPLILAVEVATPRWFSRGTRVRDFRIGGAVVLPMSSFASNLTRREGGATWTVQRWRFRVFAQDAGPLTIPPLRVFVSVNDDGEAVEGELTLRHPPLQIAVPPALPEQGEWLAAADLDVSERWDGQREDYRVGDAITRTRRIIAEDAPGMMIPAAPVADIAGLSLYRAPAVVSDSSARGRLRGTREETLVVSVEAPGDYTLPGTGYAWFDTGRGEMRMETLPAYTFTATAVAASHARDRAVSPEQLWRLGLLCAALLVLLLLAQRLPWRRLWAPLHAPARQRLLRRRFLAAALRGDGAEALTALHRGARKDTNTLRVATAGDATACAALERLLAGAYDPGTEARPLSRVAARALWRSVCGRPQRQTRPSALALNPRSGSG